MSVVALFLTAPNWKLKCPSEENKYMEYSNQISFLYLYISITLYSFWSLILYILQPIKFWF